MIPTTTNRFARIGMRRVWTWTAGFSLSAATIFATGCRSEDGDRLASNARPLAEVYPNLVGQAPRGSTGYLALQDAATRAGSRPPLLPRGDSPAPPVGNEPEHKRNPLQLAAATSQREGSQKPPESKGGTQSPLRVESRPEARTETIDLEVALRLAGVENPTIALAREQIREALANQLGARTLALPTINIGGNYHYHSGNLQASFGAVRNITSQGFYLGFGARTLAAETIAFPGVRLFAHLGDAIYEPLAAQQTVAVRRADSRAVENETMLQVSVAYMNLIAAEARLEILRQGELQVGEVVRLTRVYAERGQGRASDARRAQTHAELLEQKVRQVEEEVAVASADLCRLLSIDPSTRLRSPGGALLPFELIPQDLETEPLVNEAIQMRPELLARRAAIQEAQVRVRQERVRPFLPLISIGYSGGLFGGGGTNVASTFGPMTGRADFDAYAVWTMQNLGLGNRNKVRKAVALMGQATAAHGLELNRVREQVTQFQAEAKAAARQLRLAKNAVAAAEEGYALEADRIRQGLGLPIETMDSFQQLLDSRVRLLRTVADYDIAQLKLLVAVGRNPLSRPVPAPIAPAKN